MDLIVKELNKKGYMDFHVSFLTDSINVFLSEHDVNVLLEMEHKIKLGEENDITLPDEKSVLEWVETLPFIKDESIKYSLKKQVEIDVYFKRCVYINDYRVAGGKPYATENLPRHTLTCKVKNILDSIDENDIINYLSYKQSKGK